MAMCILRLTMGEFLGWYVYSMLSFIQSPVVSSNYSFDYYVSILNLVRCCRKRGSVLLGPLESQTSSLQTVTCPK